MSTTEKMVLSVWGVMDEAPEPKDGQKGIPFYSFKIATHLRNVRTFIRVYIPDARNQATVAGLRAGDAVRVEGDVIQTTFKGRPDIQIIPTIVERQP